MVKLFLNIDEKIMLSALYYTNGRSWVKQSSAVRHIAPLGHIIFIASQPALFFLLNVNTGNNKRGKQSVRLNP